MASTQPSRRRMYTSDNERGATYAATGKTFPGDCTLLFFPDTLGSLDGFAHIGIGVEMIFVLVENEGLKIEVSY